MIRVFISYTHDDQHHSQRVHDLATRLRNDGVNVIFDLDFGPGGPDVGWDKWSELQAEQCEIVLPVFTPGYQKCWNGEQPPGMRLGATHELQVLDRRLYNAGREISFCRTIYFEDDHRKNIPTYLQGLPAFDAQRDYSAILEWLISKGAVARPQHNQTTIIWPMPPVDYHWPLADRVEHFEAFQKIVTNNDLRRIFLIEGLGATGKTVMLHELLRLAKHLGICSALMDLKGCPSLNELLELLALDVKPDILPRFHSANGAARKTALLQDFEYLKSPLLLAFDTYQQVAPEVSDWIEGQFLRRIEQNPGLLVMIAGKQVPDHTANIWSNLASKHTLQAIKEKKYWLDYVGRVLGSHHISEDHIEALLHVSQGDPGKTSALLQTFASSKGER